MSDGGWIVRERCRAKLNPFLDVRGRRDDGYHELLTVFLEIDLGDDLAARVIEQPGAPREVHLDLAFDGVPADVPLDDRNLAVRAARALLEESGSVAGVGLRLLKRVPVGAGLGGGSADAAAVLRAVNRLLDLGASDDDLRRIGLTIGSDVPFLVGGGAAIARGRGEELEPVPVGGPFRFRVLVPEFALSTADVFGALLPGAGAPAPREPAAVLDALARGDAAALAASCSNALLEPAQRVEPRLAAVRAAAFEAYGVPIHLTGSGSALFVVDTGGLPDDAPVAGVRASLDAATRP